MTLVNLGLKGVIKYPSIVSEMEAVSVIIMMYYTNIHSMSLFKIYYVMHNHQPPPGHPHTLLYSSMVSKIIYSEFM